MAAVNSESIKNHAAFVWSVADLRRGDLKQSEYGKDVLPLTVLRRLDCVPEPTKATLLAAAARLKGKVANVALPVRRVPPMSTGLDWSAMPAPGIGPR